VLLRQKGRLDNEDKSLKKLRRHFLTRFKIITPRKPLNLTKAMHFSRANAP